MSAAYEVAAEWVHVTHVETGEFREVYGFAGGGHGTVNLEGIRLLPRSRPSKTLIVYMHPASTLQLLPLPIALWDERMSTMAVQRMMVDEADLSRARRAELVDKLAASYILQAYLDWIGSQPA